MTATTTPIDTSRSVGHRDLRGRGELLTIEIRTLSVDEQTTAVRVVAIGELDLCSVPQLANVLVEVAETAPVIELDLGGISFIDSQGAHLLLDLQRLLGRGVARVAAYSPIVERLFAMIAMPLPV